MGSAAEPSAGDIYRQLAEAPPEISVVTDHPLRYTSLADDSFDLTYRLGPVYDIIRHPDIATPIAIAIYGSWGTGKTSAMAWLHGLLLKSNEHGRTSGKRDRVKVKPVWFYPWKYLTKEDVWRGLIAEVIINSIDLDRVTPTEVANAVKRFGGFLGRSFANAMAGLSIKAKGGSMMEADLKLEGVKEILADYRLTAHPEKAYLNEFEAELRDWVNSTLQEGERLVVFIDDLDRCMPDVALQVLEALKLYLDIGKLIFVVGVDRAVIGELVREHYTKLGLQDDKSRHYLAKMFQIEVEVAPRESQIAVFFDSQIDRVSYWKKHLAKDQRQLFRNVTLALAGTNPREVKRLINSALMAAAGFLMVSVSDSLAGPSIKFEQALQLFFVRKIMSDRYQRPSVMLAKRGNEFFRQWSSIANGATQCSLTVNVPEEYIEQMNASGNGADASKREKGGVGEARLSPRDFAEEAYEGILRNPKFADLLVLLRDAQLGQLMQIEYYGETAAVAGHMGTALVDPVVRNAVARELGKMPESVTEDDFASVERINLSGVHTSSIESVSEMPSLQEINLTDTQVSDLEPLAHLGRLERLHIGGSRVRDLWPIARLQSLKLLSAVNTPVDDLGAVGQLKRLEDLIISRTRVKDLAPIQDLGQLRRLNISNTAVQDLGSLTRLGSLKMLFMSNTAAIDLDPLCSLQQLAQLDISYTRVSDWLFLHQLRDLEELDVSGIEISGEGALAICALLKLRRLRLLNSTISQSDLEHLSSFADLRIER